MLLTFKVNGNSLRFAPSPAAFRLANMGSTRRTLPQGEAKNWLPLEPRFNLA